MQPTEVREYVLRDHELIRSLLRELERTARLLIDGHLAQLGSMRDQVGALVDVLLEHMEWEDRYLRPVLVSLESGAAEQVERFDRDHVRQRDLMRVLRTRAEEEGRPPLLVASIALDLVRVLRQDMIDEEGSFLDEGLLRDGTAVVSDAPATRR